MLYTLKTKQNMIIKKQLTAVFALASFALFGQEEVINTPVPTQEISVKQDSVVKKTIKISFLDSIKSTFVNDEMATCIDNRWTQELAALDVYEDLLADIKSIDPDVKVDYELPTEVLKERLKRMDEKSPFNIEYNIGLENVIKSFLKNRKKGFERLMGISQFYFPIFEEELAKNNIPLEIKYLAVVESALNPLAVSRVGATGLWPVSYTHLRAHETEL
jgi:membrane-bound lytic murein transglycosylase D